MKKNDILEGNTLCKTIHDYLKIYLPKQRNYSAHTIRSYQHTLDMLMDFLKAKNRVSLDKVTFEMLTAEAINEYLDYIETERGCTIATRNNRLAIVRAFLVYASERDVTTIFNLDELKRKVSVKKPEAVCVIDYMSMAAVSAIVEQTGASTEKDLRDRLFIMMLYDLGARLNEMIHIRLVDIHFTKEASVTLHGKGKKDRATPISEKATRHLKKYISLAHPEPRDHNSRLFFTENHGIRTEMSPNCARDILKKYADKARAQCGEVPENVHPHLFRHSRAMHLYQQGMPLELIAQWLGHVSQETTKIYATADAEHKRKAIAAATPPDSPLFGKLNSERFTETNELTLKKLMGLR